MGLARMEPYSIHVGFGSDIMGDICIYIYIYIMVEFSANSHHHWPIRQWDSIQKIKVTLFECRCIAHFAGSPTISKTNCLEFVDVDQL